MSKHPIVFFDGYCGLCNGFVDFVIARDQQKKFRYATLQGKTAQQLLTPEETVHLDSVVVFIQQKKFKKSQAVLEVFRELGGGWQLLSVFRFLPHPLLDFFYDIVAKSRYRWFGKSDVCRLPTPEERTFFLD